jgi:hypothetical protein
VNVAFAGRQLTVSIAFHRRLLDLFPDLDLMAEYRSADRWLDGLLPSRRWRDQPVCLAKRLRGIAASRSVKNVVFDRWKRNAPRPEEHGVFLKPKASIPEREA